MAKNGNGNIWKPTAEQRKTVEAMAGYGIPQDDIAMVLDVDAKTLRKHCRRELDTGAIRANAKVAETLYKRATDGDTTACIWWTKSRMSWRETHEHNVNQTLTIISEGLSAFDSWIAEQSGRANGTIEEVASERSLLPAPVRSETARH